MKRNIALVSLFTMLIFLIGACSSSHSDQNKSADKSNDSEMDMDQSDESFADEDFANADDDQIIDDSAAEDSESFESDEKDIDRMIIHTAQLDIRVKNFNKTQLNIENKVSEYAGYVVESSVYQEDDQVTRGHMMVRIPEKHFQKFLNDTEDEAVDVLSRDVNGQDVTEQYVDLESRLTSKRVVEERLITFMEDAKKTDDLLQISTDLAEVQEEIEMIVGKMNYLENQSAYATVEISMHESQIIVPEIDNKDLNTWEKTKKQFVKSVNFILKAGSGFIVFLVGNLPMIMLFLVVGAVAYIIIRRQKKE